MAESTTTKGLLAVLCLTIVALQSALANDTFVVEGGIGPADFDEDLFDGDGNLLTPLPRARDDVWRAVDYRRVARR
jgi:hypothetical protein